MTFTPLKIKKAATEYFCSVTSFIFLHSNFSEFLIKTNTHHYMKFALQFILVLILASCQNEKPKNPVLEIDLSQDIVRPKHYVVGKTLDSILIDGKALDSAWETAKFSDLFIDIKDVKKPHFDTRMKMLWDDQYLYIFAQLEETHIWGNITERDAVIYYNNDFEVFIDPTGHGLNYGEFEINALNTIWELMLTKPYRVGGKPINSWNVKGLKSAVHIEGTLNDPSDLDSLWSVEMAIPLEALIELKDKPKLAPIEGEIWRINFSRVQWEHELIDGLYQRRKENGQYKSEYNWVWSPQRVINMHEPEKWEYLQFSESKAKETIPFIEPDHEIEKQMAYSLFRNTRFGKLKHLLENTDGFKQELRVIYKGTKTINATFYKTLFGFEIMVSGLNTNVNFIINEEGYLKPTA